ncbi:MAG: DNA repair protein MmcB-related protein [Salinarimonadaceae bacterium]|nr:MAG: DNA repair protein MmcB-related protein [Salinarimonadaceae bacterium]
MQHIPAPMARLVDGRQSQTALAIQRGVRRLFARMEMASLTELTLASGRRADVISLGRDGALVIVEIKSCLADFRADRKWPGYRDFCDRFYFAVGHDFPHDVLPDETGLIVADGFGAQIVREAPEHPLAAARRKAVTLRFARAGASALHALADPEARAAAPL